MYYVWSKTVGDIKNIRRCVPLLAASPRLSPPTTDDRTQMCFCPIGYRHRVMNKERIQAYRNLIEALLSCPSDEEELQILEDNWELLDLEFLKVCEAVAVWFANKGQENEADFLLILVSKLRELLGINKKENTDKYVEFICELLQAEESNNGIAVVYSILDREKHLLNDRFAEMLPQVVVRLIAKYPQENRGIVGISIIGNLSIHISEFPRGNRGNNIEIAIAGYQIVLNIVLSNLQHGSETWAQIQNNLGNAYLDRIRGERADNIEKAIECFTAALSVYTRDAFPEKWAATRNNLGNAYYSRIKEKMADNIEKAIECYKDALTVRTRDAFPEGWAATQNCLGNAYSDRIKEKRAENIEKALECYKDALEVRTRDAFPEDWAMTQNNLGNAYRVRIKGERAGNIEKAIAYYTAALEVYTREAFPEQWAMTQTNLGKAYLDRISGKRADNLEQAIECYKDALTVSTRDAFPEDWAMTQNNLGNAYRVRIKGERAGNLEQAIAYHKAALEVYEKDAFPKDWAGTQNNLANAYLDRIRGERADNLEQAIKCYKDALKVYKKDTFPELWAMTQNNLANAYLSKISGERADNLEQAIKHYTDALTVRTREAFPQNWAMTQNNLANAYSERIRGDRAENIEQAIKYYNDALEVYKEDAFPEDWARTQNNLAIAYSERIREKRADNIKQAIECYENALTITTREAFPQEHTETLFNLGILYRKNQQWQLAYDTFSPAIETVEFLRGEIQSGDETKQKLAEEWNKLYLGMVEVCIELKNYTEAIEYAERSKARNLVELLATRDLYPKGEIPETVQRELQRLKQEIEVEQRRLAANPKADNTHVNQLRQRYNELYPFKPILFDQIQKLIDDNTAIIEWYITGNKFATFVITSTSPQIQLWQSSQKDLNDLINWGREYLIDYTDQKDEHKTQWRQNLATRLQRLAQILHLDEIIKLVPPTVDKLVLIPHRFLHLFPLHALPVSQETWRRFNPKTTSVELRNPCLLDCFKQGVSYTPSCQLLQKAQRRQRPNFSQLFAIQNPTRDLTYANLEVQTIQQHFHPQDILIETAAKKAVIDNNRLSIADCIHFSCHGYFNFKNPLLSALLLADCKLSPPPPNPDPNRYLPLKNNNVLDLEKCLTLADIFDLDLRACRLVVLSACETGITDFKSFSDEYIGLPSGFLVAGSPSVVCSLWSVSDLSTAFLLIRFYRELTEQPSLSVPVALKKAQNWLRNLSREDFLKELDTLKLDTERRKEINRWLKLNGNPAFPFEDPAYWAAFCAIGL